ncbi:MAG: hypothetical protein CK424_00245 [Legionella sp.]|nr:MAG: hypothetical protein CK424_00245 [Legionella sp.]
MIKQFFHKSSKSLYDCFSILSKNQQKEFISMIPPDIMVTSGLNLLQKNIKTAEAYLSLPQPGYIKYIATLKDTNYLSDLIVEAGGGSLVLEQRQQLADYHAKYAEALFKFEPNKSSEMKEHIQKALQLDSNNQLAEDLEDSVTFDPFTIGK